MLTNVSLQVLYWLLVALNKFWWAGSLAGLAVLAADADDDSKWKEWLYISSMPSLIPGAAYFSIPYLVGPAGLEGTSPSFFYFVLWGLSGAAGVAGGFWFLRHGVQRWQAWSHKHTKKTALERNQKTDIRRISENLPDPVKHYNPEHYFDLEKGIFLGLGEDGKPLYMSPKRFPTTPHMWICGSSGGGKGVALGILAAQWLQKGEAVFFVDPKDDEYAPHVMAHAAKAAGVPHHFINLREPAAQFAIFEGASAAEIEELFIAGFAFNDTGTPSDFYSIADREYAGVLAREIAARNLTPAEIYAEQSESLKEAAPKLAGKLRELTEVDACNSPPGAGVSLPEVIANGGSVYIVGSMRMEKIVRLQKMLLVRLIQIAETRDRVTTKPRPVAVILDEVKYHLSRSALEGLGAARDKGVHLALAFQSVGDLKDCGALPPDAVTDAVIENCKLKLNYKVENPLTAEWLASMSGKIQVDDEARQVEKNIALTERVKGERTIRQTERFLVDENMFKGLHPITPDSASLGVVYGLGLATFSNISPLRVEKKQENISVIPAAIAAPAAAWSGDQASSQTDQAQATGPAPTLDDLLEQEASEENTVSRTTDNINLLKSML